MGSNICFISDIRQAIVAGVVLSIETARAAGPINLNFMAGVVAMAKHEALAFGIPWSFVVNDAAIALGDNLGGLLAEGPFIQEEVEP